MTVVIKPSADWSGHWKVYGAVRLWTDDLFICVSGLGYSVFNYNALYWSGLWWVLGENVDWPLHLCFCFWLYCLTQNLAGWSGLRSVWWDYYCQTWCLTSVSGFGLFRSKSYRLIWGWKNVTDIQVLWANLLNFVIIYFFILPQSKCWVGVGCLCWLIQSYKKC